MSYLKFVNGKFIARLAVFDVFWSTEARKGLHVTNRYQRACLMPQNNYLIGRYSNVSIHKPIAQLIRLNIWHYDLIISSAKK